MSQTDSENLVQETLESAKERWESYETSDFDPYDYSEIEALDVKVQSDLSGRVNEVILVTGTGGPHIEVNVTRQEISVYWGFNSGTIEYYNPEVSDEIHDYYARYFEENVVV